MLAGLTAVAVGTVLGIAGVLKLARPSAFEATLRRLVPRRLWARAHALRRGPERAAVGLASAEVVTGVALATLGGRPGVAAAAVATALTCGFVLAVARARRVGASCSCFGAIARGPAGTFETVRSLALALAAGGLLVQRLNGTSERPSLPAALAGLALGGVVVGVSITSPRLPKPIEAIVRLGGGRTPIYVGAPAAAAGPPAPPDLVPPDEAVTIVTAVRRSAVAARASALVEASGQQLGWDRAVVRRPAGRPQAAVVAVAGPASSLVVDVPDPADERSFTGVACTPSAGCTVVSGRTAAG